MELIFKPSRFFIPVFFLVVSCLQASENKLFQIVKRLKQVNPSNCHLVSYRSTIDTFKVTCIDKKLKSERKRGSVVTAKTRARRSLALSPSLVATFRFVKVQVRSSNVSRGPGFCIEYLTILLI